MNKSDKIKFWITTAMGLVVFGIVAYMYLNGEKNLFALGGGCGISLVLIWYKSSWTTGIKNALMGRFSKNK